MIRLLSGTVLMLMAMTMGDLHIALTGDVTLAQVATRLEHVSVFLLGLFLFVTGVEKMALTSVESTTTN